MEVDYTENNYQVLLQQLNVAAVGADPALLDQAYQAILAAREETHLVSDRATRTIGHLQKHTLEAQAKAALASSEVQTIRAEAQAYVSSIRADAETAQNNLIHSARSHAETINSRAASEVETVRSYASTTLHQMEAQMAEKDNQLLALRLEMDNLRRSHYQEVVNKATVAPSMASSSHRPDEYAIHTPKYRVEYTPSMGDINGGSANGLSTPSTAMYCGFCGSALGTLNRYCMSCGNDVRLARQQQAIPKPGLHIADEFAAAEAFAGSTLPSHLPGTLGQVRHAVPPVPLLGTGNENE